MTRTKAGCDLKYEERKSLLHLCLTFITHKEEQIKVCRASSFFFFFPLGKQTTSLDCITLLLVSIHFWDVATVAGVSDLQYHMVMQMKMYIRMQVSHWAPEGHRASSHDRIITVKCEVKTTWSWAKLRIDQSPLSGPHFHLLCSGKNRTHTYWLPWSCRREGTRHPPKPNSSQNT